MKAILTPASIILALVISFQPVIAYSPPSGAAIAVAPPSLLGSFPSSAYPAPNVISSFSTTPYCSSPWGIGYDSDTGKLWVSDWQSKKAKEFTKAGVPTGKVWSKLDLAFDMEYDAGRHVMYQEGSGADFGIHTWNPATGVTGTVITDPANVWSSAAQRGVAYDQASDTLYVAGSVQDKVYAVQGLGWGSPGQTIKSWSFPNPVGLAWLGDGTMAVTTEPPDLIYIVDASTMTPLFRLSYPEGADSCAAGIDSEPGGACWIINQLTRKAYRINPIVGLTRPLGTETIAADSTYTVTWGARPAADHFKAQYSRDNGATWTTIAPSTTSHAVGWQVPKLDHNNPSCRVRVTAYDSGNNVLDKSTSKPFAISVVRVISPNGGESFTSGQGLGISYSINQTITAVSTAQLSYTIDGGATWKVITIKENPGPGNFVYIGWVAPTVATDKIHCKVRLTLKGAGGSVICSDKSDGWFTIRPST